MTPKLSVVMSVFNGETDLIAAIESILKQTFTDFEFIIIDDCSTDNSYNILENFAEQDARIRLHRSKKNIGVAGFIKNLNWGISLANGEFIARMDQDDISNFERFKKQIAFFNANPNTDFVGAQISLINLKGEKTGEMSAPTGNVRIKELMPKKISLYHPVIMFRNKGFRYREKMLYCEDYDLYLNAITKGANFANLPEFLLDYRIHEKSMSRKNTFVRNLFVEKCREFFDERLRFGKDSYENFQPENFLEILNEEKVTSQKDFEFALRTALKFNNLKEFDELIKIKGQHYHNLQFKIIRLFPPKFRRAIFKFV